LSEQGYGQGQPDDTGRAAYGPSGQPQYGPGPGQGAGYPGQGGTGYQGQSGADYPGQAGADYQRQGAAGHQGQTTSYPAQGGYPRPSSSQLTDSKGFLAALFDFGFTTFVTPKIVKVLYVLIMIGLGLGALVVLFTFFRINLIAGIFGLLIVAPLYFIVSLAFYRIIMELFVVVFRISDDLRAIRERGAGLQ
jgi:Domain of unknown function (DUF4282)